jgi:hypothetical protein
MLRVIEFFGVPSGDGKCFYWEVNKETYTRVTGSKPTCFDRCGKGCYKLYPSDIVGDSFQSELPLMVRVSISGKKKQVAKDL